MHLTITREHLAWLVQTASRPIPPRSTLPSIKGCLIELFLTGWFFQELTWIGELGYLHLQKYLLQAPLSYRQSQLEDIVRTLSLPEVTLSLDESAWALVVKSGTSEMVLNAVPADDFPKWPEPSGGQQITLKDETFRDLVKVGATSAVNNPARPLWGACLLDLLGDRIVLVSTDQFALSRAQASASVGESRAIVPANVFQKWHALRIQKKVMRLLWPFQTATCISHQKTYLALPGSSKGNIMLTNR